MRVNPNRRPGATFAGTQTFAADAMGPPFAEAIENGQIDAMHCCDVAIAVWLREKLGHEPQTRDAGKDANRAGDDGHHPGKRVAIPGSQRIQPDTLTFPD